MNGAESIMRLKHHIMSRGVMLTAESVSEFVRRGIEPSLQEYATTSGIALELPGRIFVNANHNETYCKESDISLDFRQETFHLNWRDGYWGVAVVPYPEYLKKVTRTGIAFTDIIMTHNDRMRISPVRGCANRCKFCDSGFRLKYHLWDLETLLEAAAVGIRDSTLPPKHVLISGGHPFASDIREYDETILELVRRIELPVDVMLVARREISILKRLHEAGANGMSVNIEVFNQELAREIMPQKAGVGLNTYAKFLEGAVSIFGQGKVRSLMIVGLESAADTIAGIKLLSSLGVDPVLSPFKPACVTPMEKEEPPEEEFMLSLYERSLSIVENDGVVLGPRCIPCQHNVIVFPDGSDNYYYS